MVKPINDDSYECARFCQNAFFICKKLYNEKSFVYALEWGTQIMEDRNERIDG